MSEPHKILVVEDNDFVRMQIVQFLKSEDYVVVESTDGQAALDQIAGGDSYSLAIVDVRMAPIDGFEFLRVLRGSGNNTPVILVTGDSNPDLLSEANKFGVAAVMMKPVQRDRLIQTIARTLKVR